MQGYATGKLAGRAMAMIVIALATLATDLATSSPAHAQGSFLQRLFGSGERRSRVVEPEVRQPTVRRQRPAVRSQPAPQASAVTKAEDARVVLVIGDFLAGGLAEGLQASFAGDATVRIVERSNGSSGLVRDDYYNWPGSIGEILDAEQPAVVVLMVGANDGQQMRLPDGREEPLTERWSREYLARSTALAQTVRSRGIPMLWVGAPSFRLARLSSTMIALNETFKTVATGVGAEYIDIWDGFVDEAGVFTATGPDVNGQQVRLRASDGINMTQAGRAKMAFYVERPLRRILGDPSAPVPGGPAGEGVPGAAGAVDPANVDRTPPMALDDPELDGGTELLGATPPVPSPDAPKSPRDLLVQDGIAPEPQPGRADAFAAAPPPANGPAATLRPAATETTTAISR